MLEAFECVNVIDGKECLRDACWSATLAPICPDLAGLRRIANFCDACKRAGVSYEVTAWKYAPPVLTLDGNSLPPEPAAKPAKAAAPVQGSLFAMHVDRQRSKAARRAEPTLMDFLSDMGAR